MDYHLWNIIEQTYDVYTLEWLLGMEPWHGGHWSALWIGPLMLTIPIDDQD